MELKTSLAASLLALTIGSGCMSDADPSTIDQSLSADWTPGSYDFVYVRTDNTSDTMALGRAGDPTTTTDLMVAPPSSLGLVGSSPDGTRIAYMRYSGSEAPPELRLLSLVDRTDRLLVTLEPGSGIGMSPVWSPDGSRIAFSSRMGGQETLQMAQVEGGGLSLITAVHGQNAQWDCFELTWSPDGREVAFTDALGLRVIEVDMRRSRVVVAPSVGRTLCQPQWRPGASSRMIAYYWHEQTADGRPRYGLAVAQADGAGNSDLITDAFRIRHLRWAKNGNAFVYMMESWTPSEDGLYAQNLRSPSNRRKLAELGHPTETAGLSDVAADGERILFEDDATLSLVDVDGGPVQTHVVFIPYWIQGKWLRAPIVLH